MLFGKSPKHLNITQHDSNHRSMEISKGTHEVFEMNNESTTYKYSWGADGAGLRGKYGFQCFKRTVFKTNDLGFYNLGS